jgi:hypothetical protein
MRLTAIIAALLLLAGTAHALVVSGPNEEVVGEALASFKE